MTPQTDLPRRLLRATLIAVSLSVLFIVVYGGTNWLAAHRASDDVGTWYFDWELTAIPYVPLLVVPYMTLDLFFFFAPFLCRDERELHTFAKRMVFTILVAAVFFVAWPLRIVWDRPVLEGWFGEFVETSWSVPYLLEYPHNLFPSLHITLCMIVADTYIRHTRGFLRGLSYVWSGLIWISTILTWQHHLVDLAGGVMLAGYAFYFYRESDAVLPVSPNYRVGSYYAVGAILIFAFVPLTWPWGVFLTWPAIALSIVAAAYFGIGPGIFRKTEGVLPWSTRFVLAPALLGQYLSLLYYRLRCRAWDEAAPGVLIGSALSEREADEAIRQGVTAVLDLTTELSEAAPFRDLNYRNIPILDLTAPTPEQLREAVAFITEESSCGVVYVHCKLGYSRSAAVVGAYLLASGIAASPEEAIERLRAVRPSIVVRPEAMQALHAFAREHQFAFGLS